MIVFDLCCGAGDHRFEAWFASSESFADQQARGLIACPICGDSSVRKAVMAPRISAKSNQRTVAVPLPATAEAKAVSVPAMSGDAQGAGRDMMRHMLAEIAAKQAEMLPKSRWVGKDFADAARAMHEGRAAEELIHGQSSAEEVKALVDDGIPAMPLLVPVVPPESVN